MTTDEKLLKILDERHQRIIDSGQEESMQQLFMEQLQTTELDDAGWLCLLHQLLRVSEDSDEKPDST